MGTVEIKSKVTFQDLLAGVEQLESKDLEAFVEKVLKLRAKRIAPSLSEKETGLLEIANRPIAPAILSRFDELNEKRISENLNPSEHQELLKLVKDIEFLNVDRMEALAELAKIRDMSLEEIMQQLGIQMKRSNG